MDQLEKKENTLNLHFLDIMELEARNKRTYHIELKSIIYPKI